MKIKPCNFGRKTAASCSSCSSGPWLTPCWCIPSTAKHARATIPWQRSRRPKRVPPRPGAPLPCEPQSHRCRTCGTGSPRNRNRASWCRVAGVSAHSMGGLLGPSRRILLSFVGAGLRKLPRGARKYGLPAVPFNSVTVLLVCFLFHHYRRRSLQPCHRRRNQHRRQLPYPELLQACGSCGPGRGVRLHNQRSSGEKRA